MNCTATLEFALIEKVSETLPLESTHITQISKGQRFTGTLLDDGSCGLCFSFFNPDPIEACASIRESTSLYDLKIENMLQLLHVKSLNLERIIAVSVLNALSQSILKQKPGSYAITFDTDPIDQLSIHSADSVVMIGAIGGIFNKLRSITKNLVLIDEGLQNIISPTIKHLDTTENYLDRATIVIITGSSFANYTLEPLIHWASNAREIVVVGPTAGFLPDPLFDRGVTVVSGMRVLEPTPLLTVLTENGGTPHFKSYCRKYNIFKRR
ncbi:MAG: hypothetical protein EU536_01660 [Promethearchaeota archaeon]|nr:MAG: hypothetical protein EU536_01660 [Candidatus Lokiarchaeota archaeon]